MLPARRSIQVPQSLARVLMLRATNGDSICAWGESRLRRTYEERTAWRSNDTMGGVKRIHSCHSEALVSALGSPRPSMPRLSADPVVITAAHQQTLTRLVRARHAAEAGRTGAYGLAGGGRDWHSRHRTSA